MFEIARKGTTIKRFKIKSPRKKDDTRSVNINQVLHESYKSKFSYFCVVLININICIVLYFILSFLMQDFRFESDSNTYSMTSNYSNYEEEIDLPERIDDPENKLKLEIENLRTQIQNFKSQILLNNVKNKKIQIPLDKRKTTKITIAELGQYYVLENIMIERNKITFFKPNKTKFKYIRDHKKAPWIWEMNPDRYIFHFENEKNKNFSEAPCTSYLDQTVSLYPPHHSDNLWHYHNDVLLPAFWQLLHSQTINDNNKSLWFFTNIAGRMEQSSEFFPEAHILFDHVEVSFNHLNFPLCIKKFLYTNDIIRPWFNVAPGYGPRSLQYDLHARWQDYLWERLGRKEIWKKKKGEICQFVYKNRKPKLVYIARNDYRRAINAKEVIEILKKYFDVTVLEDKDFTRVNGFEKITEKQINIMKKRLNMFAETNAVIGAHGSGLAHAMFMPENTVFVRLVVAYFNEPFVFQNMAHHSHIHYYAVDLVGKEKMNEQPQNNAFLPTPRAEKLAKDILHRVLHHCHLCEMEPDKIIKPKELQSMENESCWFHMCDENTKLAGQWVQCESRKEDGCRCNSSKIYPNEEDIPI